MQNTPWWAILSLVLNLMVVMIGLKLLRRQPAAAPAAAKADAPVLQASASAAPAQAIPNRQQLIAAVIASIAELEGTDISSLRVVSFHQRRAA